MKRRIISSILVVVMLVLSLVGCGYSYTNDDLTQYMSFNKAAFDAAIANLEIEDGEFTTDEETRAKKIEAYIYDLLVKQIDTDDKLEEGTVNVNDQLHYCYYVTYTDKDGAEVVIYPSLMQESKATSIKVGSTELSEYQEKFREAIIALGGFDMAEYNYSTKTSGGSDVTVDGATAYISYTLTDKDGGTVKVQYERVTLGDDNHPVANALVGSTIGTTLTDDKDNPITDAEENTYTAAKVNWVVESGKEIVFDYTLESEKTVSDVVEGTSVTVAKDTVLTYHAYPVYYYDVEELTAEQILKTLLSSLPTDDEGNARELECLAECDDLLTALDEKITALETAEEEYDEALTDKEDAETALEEAKGNVPDGEDVDADEAVVKATSALETAKTALTEKETAKNDAETAVNTAMSDIFKKVNADDEAAGKATIVSEYKDIVKEVLIEEYNEEVKLNIAKAVWDAMVKNATVTDHPKKGVQDIYDRMYEIHENTFYTGTDSTTNQSYYAANGGDFKKYFVEEMGADNFTNAKHALWAEAEEYVADILIIYYVSDAYGLTYDKDEIKDYKKDKEGTYEYYESYYGEANTLAAYQFDALINYFVESETDEETGVVTYKNVTPVLKAED